MNHPYAAYQNAYQTVSKTRQIVMLYEGTIRFMQQAREAMEEKRIEDRYNLLIKASDVIIGLQSCLDFDADEKVARTLFDFYGDLDIRIMQLQRSNDLNECDAIIGELKAMRDVWKQIDDTAETAAPTAAATQQESSAATDMPNLEELQNSIFVSV